MGRYRYISGPKPLPLYRMLAVASYLAALLPPRLCCMRSQSDLLNVAQFTALSFRSLHWLPVFQRVEAEGLTRPQLVHTVSLAALDAFLLLTPFIIVLQPQHS